jgi:hypothetical protein
MTSSPRLPYNSFVLRCQLFYGIRLHSRSASFSCAKFFIAFSHWLFRVYDIKDHEREKRSRGSSNLAEKIGWGVVRPVGEGKRNSTPPALVQTSSAHGHRSRRIEAPLIYLLTYLKFRCFLLRSAG